MSGGIKLTLFLQQQFEPEVKTCSTVISQNSFLQVLGKKKRKNKNTHGKMHCFQTQNYCKFYVALGLIHTSVNFSTHIHTQSQSYQMSQEAGCPPE